jgi:hypothetical protein
MQQVVGIRGARLAARTDVVRARRSQSCMDMVEARTDVVKARTELIARELGRVCRVMVVVGACWNYSPVAEATESVVVELILNINPSKLYGDVSEVDRERGRCRYT